MDFKKPSEVYSHAKKTGSFEGHSWPRDSESQTMKILNLEKNLAQKVFLHYYIKSIE